MRVIYSDSYCVDIGEHVFPTIKYRLIHNRLIKNGFLKVEDFIEPTIATDEDVLLVHTNEYIDKMRAGKFTSNELFALEVPFSAQLFRASVLCAGGTIMACNIALDNGLGIHIGGGFHHAFPDHGEGFCLINDIAIGVLRCKRDGRLKRALIVDCDLHQGNGTAQVFSDAQDVYTFSIHQENNYPLFKPHSRLDIGLADGTDDEGYLNSLRKNLTDIFKDFNPQLILYVAGADPYKEDQLGGLALTKEGLMNRDEFVLGLAHAQKIPVAIVLGGGYAKKLEDTVEIHCNTIKAAIKIFGINRHTALLNNALM